MLQDGDGEKDGYKRKVRALALCYLITMRGEGVWAEGDTGELDRTLVRPRRTREMSTCEEKPWHRQPHHSLSGQGNGH